MRANWRRWTLVLAAAAAAAGGPGAAAAQTVARRGDGDVFIDDRIDRILAGGRYFVVTGDTVLTEADTVPGSLFVLGRDATAHVGGVVEGDVIGVEADVFIEPSARIAGDEVNLGGGLYASELATVRERLDLPTAPYYVVRRGDRLVIVSEPEEPDLRLDGKLYGLHVPRYNRVDGLAIDWGAAYRLARIGHTDAIVHGQGGYRTDRGAWGWGGSLRLERGGWTLEGGAERATASNDRWIRSDLKNSLRVIWDGVDVRNYYEARRDWVELRHQTGDEDAPRHVRVGLRLQQERASSLETGNPWHLFGDDTLRFNPPVNDGRIRSVIPWVEGDWLAQTYSAKLHLDVEYGQPDSLMPRTSGRVPLAAGPGLDDAFWRLHARLDWSMKALRNQTLDVEAHYFTPLGGGSPLPLQRREMLGGSGTLRTLDQGAMFGDHLVFEETTYHIPLPESMRLPILGVPELQLIHAAGSAWTGSRDVRFVQNVGAKLQAFIVYVRYLVDPATGDDALSFGVSMPSGGGLPWQGAGFLK